MIYTPQLSAFGNLKLLDELTVWDAYATTSMSSNNEAYLFNTLESDLECDHWRPAMHTESGSVASAAVRDKKDSLVYQRIISNGFSATPLIGDAPEVSASGKVCPK